MDGFTLPLSPRTRRFNQYTSGSSGEASEPNTTAGPEMAGPIETFEPSSQTSSHTGINANSTNTKGLQKVHGSSKFYELLNQTQRIVVSESSSGQDQAIPTYSYESDKPSDPISLVESKFSEGHKFGAIKLMLGSLHRYMSSPYHSLDPDSFKCKTKNVVCNPSEHEINDRLAFLLELIQVHASKNDLHQQNQPPQSLSESKPTSMAKINLSRTNFQAQSEIGTSNTIITSDNSRATWSVSACPESSSPANGNLEEKLWVEDKPLDLYKFFNIMQSKGGFLAVATSDHWSEIAHELGYLHSDVRNLNLALSGIYANILHPLELKRSQKELPSSQVSNSSGTETSVSNSVSIKQQDIEPDLLSTTVENQDVLQLFPKRRKFLERVPFLKGVAEDFKRSVRSKASKGIVLNSPNLLDLSNPSASYPLDLPTSSAAPPLAIGAKFRLNTYLKWISWYMTVITDSSSTENSDYPSTLRQVMEADSEYQKMFLRSLQSKENGLVKVESFLQSTTPDVTSDTLESHFWKSMDDFSSLKSYECCSHLSFHINQVGSSRASDCYIRSKGFNSGVGSTRQSDSAASFRSSPSQHSLDSIKSHSAFGSLESNPWLHPFNLHNLPYLPNSLLGALSEADLDDSSLTTVSLNINTTFGVDNWRCEDHFTQLCDYLVAGAWKRWYFIPEQEFEKFEALLAKVVKDNLRDINDSIGPYLSYLNTGDQTSQQLLRFLLLTLNGVTNCYPQIRLGMDNIEIQHIFDKRSNLTVMNQELMITPSLLNEHGIRYTTTIQKPGEMVFKFPKTYSFSISFGFNISESINFASASWLKHAMEGERWLAKQSLLPNFLVFKLIVNLIHMMDPVNGKMLHFDSRVNTEVSAVYSDLLDQELELRQLIRKKFKPKEILLEEKVISEVDKLSDVDFQPLYPTNVQLLMRNYPAISMSVLNLAWYLKLSEKDEQIPSLLSEGVRVELHLFCSDEKLRSYRRILQESSMDFQAWQEKYMTIINSEELTALKTYRALFFEGQKILTALSGLSQAYLQFKASRLGAISGDNFMARLALFKEQLAELGAFVDDSNEIVEQCQTILSLKHQQRIRNGSAETQAEEKRDNDNKLLLLVDLCNMIPKLSFFSPEFEQVFEFKSEIESFDRACRQLIAQNNLWISDIKDMVSLGSSFGIKTASLEFLVLLQNKLEWIKVYETIISGGDPFLGKKDIFLLPDLEKFRVAGLECLSSADLDKLSIIDQYLAVGYKLDLSVEDFIRHNNILNDVNFDDLVQIMTDMEERVKLSGERRLFVNLDTYQKLVDLRSQEGKIRFLQMFQKESHSLFDVKQMLLELGSVPYEKTIEDIEIEVAKSHDWLHEIDICTEAIKVHRISANSSFSRKQACNPKLAQRLQMLIDNCKTTFADMSVDTIEDSAPYAFYNGLESSEGTQLMKYCLCRDLEDGAMIECDLCHEWFHFSCVSHISSIGDDADAKYTCPACLVLDRFRCLSLVSIFPDKLPEEKFVELIMRGESLRVKPMVELGLLKELLDVVVNFKSWANTPLTSSLNERDAILANELISRKVLGAPVIVGPLLEHYLRQLLNVARPVPDCDRDDIKAQVAPNSFETVTSAVIGSAGDVKSVPASADQILVIDPWMATVGHSAPDVVPIQGHTDTLVALPTSSAIETGMPCEQANEAMPAALEALDTSNIGLAQGPQSGVGESQTFVSPIVDGVTSAISEPAQPRVFPEVPQVPRSALPNDARVCFPHIQQDSITAKKPSENPGNTSSTMPSLLLQPFSAESSETHSTHEASAGKRNCI